MALIGRSSIEARIPSDCRNCASLGLCLHFIGLRTNLEWLHGSTIGARRSPPPHLTALPTATFYPEPGVDEYVASAIDRGARIFKVHLQVGAFDPRNALLAPVWGQLAEAGIPVVVHCGSGPVAGSSPARGQSVRLSHATRTSS